jgi:PhnB protein
MASQLNPYLNFNGNARQAMEFYRGVFGGELTVTTFAQMGDGSPDAELIMHAYLQTPAGYGIMGADVPGGMEYNPISGASVSISGDDAEALRGYWDQLSASGIVTMPLERQAWGDEFGMCTDQFGVPWMVNIADAPES